MDIRDRFNISRLAIEHPRFTVVFWIVVCVAGVFAFRTLKFALLPDISFPVVVVTATAPEEISKEDLARDVSLPMELRLREIEGLGEVHAAVRPPLVIITVFFRVGQTLEECKARVAHAVADIKPLAGTTIKISTRNLNQTSVATYVLSVPGKSTDELLALARQKIIQPLRTVEGVEEVAVLGETQVSENESPVLARFRGADVLALDIVKQAHANTIEVADRVESEVARLRAALPGVNIVLARTQADYIREASHSTVEALLIAVALSVVVIYPFVWSWPATAISALAIPTSLLGTAIVMALCGFELDTITLLALALVIGIIIDDAIVAVENIVRHLEEGGDSSREAALSATKEIGLTIAAATFTIVAVFLPVGLMKGSIGQFFKPFGVTVSAAVIISLLVALTLSPALAAWRLRSRLRPNGESSTWLRVVGVYRRALDWSLDHPKSVFLLAALSLAAGLALIPLVPQGLIPRLDRGEFKLGFRLTPATLADASVQGVEPLAKTGEVAKQIESFVAKFPGVTDVYSLSGTREGDPSYGVLYVRLAANRNRHTAEIQDELRAALPKIAGVNTSIEDVPFIDLGEQTPIDFAVVGDDAAAVGKGADLLLAKLRAEKGFVDVATSVTDPPEMGPLTRLNARPAVYLTSNLSGNLSLGAATRRVNELAAAVLPAGVSVELGGDSANIRRVFTSFGITLGLAIACILVVLVMLFRNWVDPLIIVLTLPLAVVGAVLALLVVRSEFGMISLLGVVFLFGLVNKNAILLVDYINQLRRGGMDCREAIRRAGEVRLRPILMTTLATILGMMPVAIGLGVGSELRAPMAVAIIGGLITSTLLSLLIVPVLYASMRGRATCAPAPGL